MPNSSGSNGRPISNVFGAGCNPGPDGGGLRATLEKLHGPQLAVLQTHVTGTEMPRHQRAGAGLAG